MKLTDKHAEPCCDADHNGRMLMGQAIGASLVLLFHSGWWLPIVCLAMAFVMAVITALAEET